MPPAARHKPTLASPTAETLAESAGDAGFATTLAKGLVVLEAFEAGAAASEIPSFPRVLARRDRRWPG
jgi:hypothetical protein